MSLGSSWQQGGEAWPCSGSRGAWEKTWAMLLGNGDSEGH